MYRQIFFLGLAMVLSACGQSGAREEKIPAGTIVFDSFIDFPVVDDFAARVGSGKYDTVRLSSPGGNPLAALALLKILAKHSVTIEVRGICMSACAEIALLAKNDVRFIENPVFGVHYNAYSTDFLLKRFGHEEAKICYKGKVKDKFSAFIEDTKIEENYNNFSTEMMNRLDFYDSRDAYLISKTSGCPGVEFASKRAFWFPTSNQLAVYFDHKFHGSLAADASEPDLKRFSEAAGRNRYVVIGDRVAYMPK